MQEKDKEQGKNTLVLYGPSVGDCQTLLPFIHVCIQDTADIIGWTVQQVDEIAVPMLTAPP